MSLPIKLDEARAEHLLECLKKGKALKPATAGRWSVNDVMSLAGAVTVMLGRQVRRANQRARSPRDRASRASRR
jgi:hypothetical protein